MLAGVLMPWVMSIKPVIRIRLVMQTYKEATFNINHPITFGLRAQCKESIVCEEFEQRPNTIRISSHMHFSVGSVQKNESKYTIQERSHLLNAKAVIKVEQNLTIHFSLAIKLKLLPQLKEQMATK